MATPPAATYVSLAVLREEAHRLICGGILHPQQPIYSLCQFIPACEWSQVECELERHDFLLRDRLIDLVAQMESWTSD